MKQSQAFAAFRQSLISNLSHALENELVPEFNSRCEDIRRRSELDFETYHNRAKSDNLKKTLTYDLVLHRNAVIDDLQKNLRSQVVERLAGDGAEIREEEVPDPKKEGRMRRITTALFPDQSKARVPNSLWIDY